MQLYLPIADLPVNVFLVLAMGAAVGFVSGMFGIGGGFLMTPLLIFVGITPAVAVASVASHIAASSFSGAIAYWRRRAIDPALAAVLLTGGTAGTALGVSTFTYLRSLGQLDLMIALSYVVLLTAVGSAMFWEGLRALLRVRRGGTVSMRKSGSHAATGRHPAHRRSDRSAIESRRTRSMRWGPRSGSSFGGTAHPTEEEVGEVIDELVVDRCLRAHLEQIGRAHV